MPSLDVFRASTFRLAGLSGAAFAVSVVMLGGLIYWQAARYESDEIDIFIERSLREFASQDETGALTGLSAPSAPPGADTAAIGLFSADGALLAGNFPAPPLGLPLDGKARQFGGAGLAGSAVRAAGIRLRGGRVLVMARDLSQVDELQHALLRALAIGVLPMSLLSLAVGLLLGGRAVRRVRAVHRTIERIMSGSLRERLVISGVEDDLDRLSRSVNWMLDRIEALLEEVAGIGDDIAHDLRTPLTRVRTRLEWARAPGQSKDAMIEGIEAAISGLDQALAVITALLRIAEIEDGRRRAAFGDVDLSAVVRDIAELYEPIAETSGIALTVDAGARLSVIGDRDLLIEAIANVIDNAIKFTPTGGRVVIAAFERGLLHVVRITDSGPGIPTEERAAVMKRFYRSDKSRHHRGSGLGLGLVQAITRLHGFTVAIDDAKPGCIVEFLCPKGRPA